LAYPELKQRRAIVAKQFPPNKPSLFGNVPFAAVQMPNVTASQHRCARIRHCDTSKAFILLRKTCLYQQTNAGKTRRHRPPPRVINFKILKTASTRF